MGKHFLVNDNLFYDDDPQAAANVFLKKWQVSAGNSADEKALPRWEEAKALLPAPLWESEKGKRAIAMYDTAWRLAFGNLRRADPRAGFVSDYIDTAFNGYLFMWDSSFIVMFGKYGRRAFDFQKTLDNFYSHQHKDGFICREICESEPGEQFARDDPASTGPNILPWAEWEYFESTGDKSRLADVWDPLCAYHRWLQKHRSWPDGSYFSCGLACGMDNQPRQPAGMNAALSHGFMSWIDACAEQYFSAKLLQKMAAVLGKPASDILPLAEEERLLADVINNTMWSEADGFYYDKYRDGSLSGVKTVGAYWTLAAELVPRERLARFLAPLSDPAEFNRPCPVPSLSASHPAYRADGGYWLGGVWAPTDYMLLRGLSAYGQEALAGEIADRFFDHVLAVYDKTGTLFENYAPEYPAPGVPAKSDFVGWTGLVPISILLEYLFGLRPRAGENTLDWHLRKTERHGVLRYPFGEEIVDLICEARGAESEMPRLTVRTSRPFTLRLFWGGEKQTALFKVTPDRQVYEAAQAGKGGHYADGI